MIFARIKHAKRVMQLFGCTILWVRRMRIHPPFAVRSFVGATMPRKAFPRTINNTSLVAVHR